MCRALPMVELDRSAFLEETLVLEKYCEAVAAERAGWTERTAGQQPADALIKISAGGRKPSSKPRVKPIFNRLNAGVVISRKLPAKTGARGGTGKEGSPAGRKPERLSPSGWKYSLQRGHLHTGKRAEISLHVNLCKITPGVLHIFQTAWLVTGALSRTSRTSQTSQTDRLVCKVPGADKMIKLDKK